MKFPNYGQGAERSGRPAEKDEAMMRKVRGAMVYPAIVLMVIIAVIVFMLVMVVPQVKGLGDDMGKTIASGDQDFGRTCRFY